MVFPKPAKKRSLMHLLKSCYFSFISVTFQLHSCYFSFISVTFQLHSCCFASFQSNSTLLVYAEMEQFASKSPVHKKDKPTGIICKWLLNKMTIYSSCSIKFTIDIILLQIIVTSFCLQRFIKVKVASLLQSSRNWPVCCCYDGAGAATASRSAAATSLAI